MPKEIKQDERGNRYIQCEECGRNVYLVYALDNECFCGADYNYYGQRVLSERELREDY